MFPGIPFIGISIVPVIRQRIFKGIISAAAEAERARPAGPPVPDMAVGPRMLYNHGCPLL